MPNAQKTVSFSELETWAPAGTTVAVLGLESSFHAGLYSAAMANLLPLNPQLSQWNFVAVEASPGNLREVILKLHEKNVWGVILTRPFKSLALQLLTAEYRTTGPIREENGAPVSAIPPQIKPPIGTTEALAERVGAVNLLTWRPNGYWGISTDGAAWLKAVESDLHTKVKGKTVIVIGAGAMARAVAVEALQWGCRELWLGNRTQENAWDAIDQILPSMNMRGRTHTFNLLKPSPKVPRSALIVNTLPIEARDEGNPALDLTRFDRSSLYFDVSILPSVANKTASSLDIMNCTGTHLWTHQILDHIERLIGVKPGFDFVQWAVSEAAAAGRL